MPGWKSVILIFPGSPGGLERECVFRDRREDMEQC